MFPDLDLPNGFSWVFRRIPERWIVLLIMIHNMHMTYLCFLTSIHLLFGEEGYMRCLFTMKFYIFPLIFNMVIKFSSLSRRIVYSTWKTRGPKEVFCKHTLKFLWFSSRILFTLDRESMPARLLGDLVNVRRECVIGYNHTFPAGDGIRI